MLKLTTIHIEEIRKYFLATNEEEQLIIQKNIRPSYLSNFLPEIKNLFNSKVSDLGKLSSVAKSMGAEDHLKVLKEIQQDYYSHLAEQYNSGALNPDIESLMKVQNRDFLQEVEFQKELKTAFKQNERESFKKKFQQLDKESDIDTDEMSQAFKLIERQKLKKQFQKFEKGNELEAIGMVAEPLSEYSIKKGSADVIKFKWRPIAIAASIVGFLGLAAYILILVEGKKESNQMAINRNNQIDLFGKDNNLTDSGRAYKIKEQRAIGTDGTLKTDSIKVIVRDVSAMADLINFKISFLINKFDSAVAIEHAAKNKHHDLDSLKSLQDYLHLISNTYSYSEETKTITLNVPANDSLITVYRYPASAKQPSIYIKLNTFFYKIDTTITPILLKQLNDRSLIEILERI